jgi:hypothetical protein
MGNTQQATTEPDETYSEPDASPLPRQTQGTDVTFHVNDLLRYTSRKVDWEDATVIRDDVDGVEGAFVLHNLLSPNECKQLIEIGEDMGYEPSPLSILSGNFDTSERNQSTTHIRDSSRVLCDVPLEMLNVVRDRIVDHLPQRVTVNDVEWSLKRDEALNGRWRWNRYAMGQKFAPHMDAGFRRNANEMTQLTFIAYLNGEELDGGETTFFPGGKKTYMSAPNSTREVPIKPETGKALIFFQAGMLNHRHEGAKHNSEGKFKYIIRSDIMYERVIKV